MFDSDNGDNNNKEKREIQREINKGLTALRCPVNYYGGDSNLENSIPRSLITANYGCCNKCEHFFATETEFKGTVALCDQNPQRPFYLKSVDPILKCSRFERKGAMTVGEMQLIATIINPEKKDRVGII